MNGQMTANKKEVLISLLKGRRNDLERIIEKVEQEENLEEENIRNIFQRKTRKEKQVFDLFSFGD